MEGGGGGNSREESWNEADDYLYSFRTRSTDQSCWWPPSICIIDLLLPIFDLPILPQAAVAYLSRGASA